MWDFGGDLSGTLVTSNKPVFVTSGTESGSVLYLDYPDNLMVNLPPVERLGTDYVLCAVADRTVGDVLRIICKHPY